MPNAIEPCALDDESVERSILRTLVDEYDELYEICMNRVLTAEDQRTLNELYECLTLKEAEYWDNTSEELIAAINERMEVYFPLIRFVLGIMPDQNITIYKEI